jgi:hypothetical protein
LHFGWGNVAEPAGEGELGLYFEDRSVSMMQEEKEFLVGASELFASAMLLARTPQPASTG